MSAFVSSGSRLWMPRVMADRVSSPIPHLLFDVQGNFSQLAGDDFFLQKKLDGRSGAVYKRNSLLPRRV
ncbi:protein of unknown function [Trichlorobacter ammonificans]|uniref:Uncharacterized protein n=1 Tax=Trichlorobacter ammonificans TaxID=2916410 RepID=A0ABM9D549_9BACT|nr:protein of unknown function [Trichlorobacter ammonificans]